MASSLDRSESISLDPVSELKRQRSATPAPVKSVPKLARQNTEMEYAGQFLSIVFLRILGQLGAINHLLLLSIFSGLFYPFSFYSSINSSEITSRFDSQLHSHWQSESHELLLPVADLIDLKVDMSERIPFRYFVVPTSELTLPELE